MTNASGFTCIICRDSICCDLTKYPSIMLTCGHAFGKTCMRKWVESSYQKECLLCRTPLTDNEINEIKNIPLQERAIIILKKAIKLFGQTISNIVPLSAARISAAYATGTGTAPAVGSAGFAAGALGVVIMTAVTAGFTTVITEIAAVTAGTAAGVTAGVTAGALGAAAEVDRANAQAVGGAIGLVGALGMAAATFGALGAAAGTEAPGALAAKALVVASLGITAGPLGANAAYDEQEINPVVV